MLGCMPSLFRKFIVRYQLHVLLCNTSTVDHFPHGIYFIMLGSRMHRKDIQGIVRLSK